MQTTFIVIVWGAGTQTFFGPYDTPEIARESVRDELGDESPFTQYAILSVPVVEQGEL